MWGWVGSAGRVGEWKSERVLRRFVVMDEKEFGLFEYWGFSWADFCASRALPAGPAHPPRQPNGIF